MKGILIVVSPSHNFFVPARILKEPSGYMKGSNVLVRFCALLLLLALFGCVIGHGTKIDVAKAEQIRVGSTTKSEISQMFGQPLIRRSRGSTEFWMYQYSVEYGDIIFTGTLGKNISTLELNFKDDVVVDCQIILTERGKLKDTKENSHPCGKGQ